MKVGNYCCVMSPTPAAPFSQYLKYLNSESLSSESLSLDMPKFYLSLTIMFK